MSNLSCKAAGKCAKHTGLRMMRQVERTKSMNPKSMNPKSMNPKSMNPKPMNPKPMTRPNGKQGIKKRKPTHVAGIGLFMKKISMRISFLFMIVVYLVNVKTMC